MSPPADEESDRGQGPLYPEQARAHFPALERSTYFATNGQGILPKSARDRLVSGADALMQRGYAGALRLESEVERVRDRVGRLLGASAGEVAFVRNTGEGLCLVADLLDWVPGDEVLCFAGEYRSVVHAFQGAAHRGVTVRVADLDEQGCVTPERIRQELRPGTRAVVLSWVRYDNGARADLQAIGAVLEAAGVLLVVDGIQGLGALPLDVRACGVSFLCAGAHKWLLGVPGTGILYVRADLQPALVATHLGVQSMVDAGMEHRVGDPYPVEPIAAARRVEEGSRNVLGIVALGASLELYERVGAEAVAGQIKAVTDRLCEGFRSAGGRVRSPRSEADGGAASWSGIFLLEPPPGVDAAGLHRRLLQERIVLGVREGALWGSAHYFNDLADADRLLSFL